MKIHYTNSVVDRDYDQAGRKKWESEWRGLDFESATIGDPFVPGEEGRPLLVPCKRFDCQILHQVRSHHHDNAWPFRTENRTWEWRSSETAKLSQHSTLETLVRACQETEEVIIDTFTRIRNAEERINEVFTMEGHQHIYISPNSYSRRVGYDIDAAIEEVRRRCWGNIVERLELRRMMSVGRWNELNRELDDKKPEPITPETVAAFAERHRGNLKDMLAEAVDEVFDWLRPQSGRHKTNSRLEIQKRIILTGTIEWFIGSPKVHYHQTQRVMALENVVHALDGKGQIAKGYNSNLENAIKASKGQGETDYFKFRACGNGNLHLEWKRLDLLKKFNMLAGGKRLRPSEAA